jgi:hypothetical protein
VYCPNRECPDFAEDGIPGEYVETITVCPKCGATLVPEWPPIEAPDLDVPDEPPTAETLPGETAEPQSQPGGPLVAVAAFDYPDETEPLVAALAAAGVSVFQFLDDGRDFEDASSVPVCTRVLVPASQAPLAAVVLEQVKRVGGA